MKRSEKVKVLSSFDYAEYLINQTDAYRGSEKAWSKDIIDILEDGSSERKIILILGSGIGIVVRELLRSIKEKGLEVEIMGVDIDPKMVGCANNKTKEEGFTDFSFKQGDMREMPFLDNYFDMVITTYTAFFFDPEERIKVFNETYRVLKSGGKFCFFNPQRNRLVYSISYMLSRKKPEQEKEFQLWTTKASYTIKETKNLLKKSLLKEGKVKRKWGPLMIKTFGVVAKI